MEPLVDESTARPKALVPELQDYFDQFEAIRREVVALADGLTEAQMNWQPEAGRWSIAQCLEHLLLETRLDLPRIEEMIAKGRAQQLFSDGPYRHGLMGRFIVWSNEPPPRFKVKTFPEYTPAAHVDAETVRAETEAMLTTVQNLIRRANGLDLGRLRARSPIIKFAKQSLGQVFAHHAAHHRRHLWQAQRVKEDPAFPQA